MSKFMTMFGSSLESLDLDLQFHGCSQLRVLADRLGVATLFP